MQITFDEIIENGQASALEFTTEGATFDSVAKQLEEAGFKVVKISEVKHRVSIPESMSMTEKNADFSYFRLAFAIVRNFRQISGESFPDLFQDFKQQIEASIAKDQEIAR
jgi:hypothetical protein